MVAVRDDDHVVALYKKHNCWGAVAKGVTRAAVSWAQHRAIKEPLRRVVKNPALAERVGPGEAFSI